MTEIQERLFKHMGGREAYDALYRLMPGFAAELEAERTAEYNRTVERDVSQDNIFYVAANPTA